MSFSTSKALETDVTVVNPCAPSKLMHTLSKPGSALRSRCEDKNRKYLDQARLRGNDFTPLGFETHGRFGQHVLCLLTKLAGNTPDHLGHSVAEMSLDLSHPCEALTIARALRFRDLTRS